MVYPSVDIDKLRNRPHLKGVKLQGGAVRSAALADYDSNFMVCGLHVGKLETAIWVFPYKRDIVRRNIGIQDKGMS